MRQNVTSSAREAELAVAALNRRVVDTQRAISENTRRYNQDLANFRNAEQGKARVHKEFLQLQKQQQKDLATGVAAEHKKHTNHARKYQKDLAEFHLVESQKAKIHQEFLRLRQQQEKALSDQVAAQAKKNKDLVQNGTSFLGGGGFFAGIGKFFGPEGALLGAMADSIFAVVKAAAEAAVVVGGLIAAVGVMILRQREWREELLATLGALSDVSDGGPRLLYMIDELSKKIPKSKEQIAEWTKAFLGMGLHGNELKNSVQAIAGANVLGGSEGANAFREIQQKIQAAREGDDLIKIPKRGQGALSKTGADLKDIAKQMGITSEVLSKRLEGGTQNATEFGEALKKAIIVESKTPLEKAMLGFTVQIEKAWEAINHLFDDVKVDKFLTQMKSLLSIFDDSTEEGQSFKQVLTVLSNALFDVAADAIPTIKEALIELSIFVMDTASDVIEMYLAFTHFKKNHSTTFELLIESLGLLKIAFEAIYNPAGAFFDLLSKTVDIAKTLGNALGDSFAQGIQKTGSVVKASGAGMGTEAVTGLTDKTEMHSPSKVMIEKGGFMAKGFSMGMDEALPDVNNSGSKMGSEASNMKFGNGKSAGGGISLSVGEIHISGAGKDAETITEEMISLIFERVAMTQGVL